MRFLWDQLAASEPVIKTVSEAQLVNAHRVRQRLHQFFMGILNYFESVHSRLLIVLLCLLLIKLSMTCSVRKLV
jgi:hypothetical protein